MHTPILESVRTKARDIWHKNGILDERVSVHARTLSVEEAIGDPEGDDFPLQRGKERLMEAAFGDARGQAFTDRYGDFDASLREICDMPLENNFRRALFVAALNAVQRRLAQTDHTIHCRDKGPSHCAPKLADYITETYGAGVRITQIGYQPKMLETLAPRFSMRIVDLDPDNIGAHKCGLTVLGPDDTDAAIQWADLLLVTGSTLVNGTVDTFLGEKPVLFFGTTIAAAADLMGWDRFCCESM
ncbi:Rossmann-like domain-containing protein [Desulfobaculum sp. SPO524]|uniref:Rossmann-like domain-containing protein n=1 Tax=Desulfobaculum sp. SPO524 TaxID=3378071 RepID=UPI003853D501